LQKTGNFILFLLKRRFRIGGLISLNSPQILTYSIEDLSIWSVTF